jgi:hypothetical protein
LIDAHDPERSISANAGALEHKTNARATIVLFRIMSALH